jgi:haloalkane dehalogenase
MIVMADERIVESLDFPSKYVEVLGSKIHYIEAGEGAPIVFLHGVPMSCYVWRNIIPHLTNLGRCIALDLIGFGKSDKPNIQYSIFDHIKYFEKFVEILGLKKMTLVMHGWGSVIGFDYAMRHEKNCTGLVFYEAFLRSVGTDDISLPFQEQLYELQEEASDNNLVVSGTNFVNKIIPQNVMRRLSAIEMSHYREPFADEKSSQAIKQYLKELPRGEDTPVTQLIANYSEKLTESYLPKLMLYSVPGLITTIMTAMWAKENLPNLEMFDLGEELHLAQESNPQLMGETISVWLQSNQ